MKNITIITSQEYYANTPSVFAVVDGKYFGCLIYPVSRKFPSVDYWFAATSSDSDRGFALKESAISEELLLKIEKLQACINANEAMVVRKSYPFIPKNWKVRRGKAYEDYKVKKEAQQAEIKAEFEHNEPFDRARSIAFRELRQILISL